MQDLADKLSHLLDLVKDIDDENKLDEDIATPLLETQRELSGVLSTGSGIKLHEFNVHDIDKFFQKVSHKIEYLFWLSQNIENENMFNRLIDFLSHYENQKQTFYTPQVLEYQEESLSLHEYDIDYNLPR